MIFVDGIVLTQKFKPGSIRTIAGLRRISFREAGDINLEGKAVEETEVLPEQFTAAWLIGSHDSKIQVRSDGTTLSIKGNPGKWGRADNLFNLGLDATIEKANEIVQANGFPAGSFKRGEADPYTVSQLAKIDIKSGETPEDPWTGSRIWTIHLTQNYATGSADNAKMVIDWLGTQTIARVKKSRLGATTIVWGNIRYAQVECYIKADELLAHAKSPEAKAAVRESAAYKYALENGIIRLEIKCAKDFLKARKLTYLGNWDMGTVTKLFEEKAEILQRCSVVRAEDDEAMLEALPRSSRVHAAAWLQGIDVAKYMSRATLFRHAKILREYGIDIMEKRNVEVARPKLKEVSVSALALPEWYQLQAA